MDAHQKLKAVFHTYEQMLAVVDIDIEFTFDSVVDHYARFDADFVIFRVPVSFISNWHTVPSVRVMMSESFTYAFDDSFGEDVGLYITS